MKIRLLLALAGFAISFVFTTFAQKKDTVDPRISQQRDLLGIPGAKLGGQPLTYDFSVITEKGVTTSSD
jgi:hypothetical protein